MTGIEEVAAVAAIVGAGAAVAGTAVAVVGQMQAADAAGKTAKYNRTVAEQDAIAAGQQADRDAQLSQDAAAVRISNIRRSGAATIAEGQSLMGVSGVEAGSGSPLLVQANNMKEVELAAQREQYSGNVESQNFQYQGMLAQRGFNIRGQLAALEGQQAQRAAYFGAGTTLLTGAGETAKRLNSFYGTHVKKETTTPDYGGLFGTSL